VITGWSTSPMLIKLAVGSASALDRPGRSRAEKCATHGPQRDLGGLRFNWRSEKGLSRR